MVAACFCFCFSFFLHCDQRRGARAGDGELTDLWSGWSDGGQHSCHSGGSWCVGCGSLLSSGLHWSGGCGGDLLLEAGKHLSSINSEFSWRVGCGDKHNLHNGGVDLVWQLSSDGVAVLLWSEHLGKQKKKGN